MQNGGVFDSEVEQEISRASRVIGGDSRSRVRGDLQATDSSIPTVTKVD